MCTNADIQLPPGTKAIWTRARNSVPSEEHVTITRFNVYASGKHQGWYDITGSPHAKSVWACQLRPATQTSHELW